MNTLGGGELELSRVVKLDPWRRGKRIKERENSTKREREIEKKRKGENIIKRVFQKEVGEIYRGTGIVGGVRMKKKRMTKEKNN
jgi:hypothetical protein